MARGHLGSPFLEKIVAVVPDAHHWLFWNVDIDALELNRDADHILARVLELGRLEDVHWVIDTYGYPRIHRFFRDVGHPDMSLRTITFWRAVFKAEDEEWTTTPEWRRSNAAPWID